MTVFLIVLIILLFIFTILVLPVHAGVEYLHSGTKQRLFVHFKILGIPIKIPIALNGKKNSEKEKKKSDTAPKKKLTLARFKKLCASISTAYSETKSDIKGLLSFIRQKVSFKLVSFRVHFGLSDAAKTGIATGAAWTSSSCLASVINQMFGVQKIDLDVNPDFNRECFNLHIKGILILRPVHIISIGFKVFKIVNVFIERMDFE